MKRMERTVYHVGFGGSLYVAYDPVRRTATVVGSGRETVMPEERLREFVQIARTLGLDAGTMDVGLDMEGAA